MTTTSTPPAAGQEKPAKGRTVKALFCEEITPGGVQGESYIALREGTWDVANVPMAYLWNAGEYAVLAKGRNCDQFLPRANDDWHYVTRAYVFGGTEREAEEPEPQTVDAILKALGEFEYQEEPDFTPRTLYDEWENKDLQEWSAGATLLALAQTTKGMMGWAVAMMIVAVIFMSVANAG